jgi:hypothetical protein
MMPFQGCRVMIIISYDHCVRPKIRILDRFFLKKSKIISKILFNSLKGNNKEWIRME